MKIWCPLCRKPVEVGDNYTTEDVLVNHGTRKRANSVCPKHHKPISGFISTKPAPPPAKRKKRRKARNPWDF